MIIHNPVEVINDPKKALELLQRGNERFVHEKTIDRKDYAEVREKTQDEQKPFAAVICCSDSRVSPEVFFDQGIEDIFVIRNAGNVIDDIVCGSLEYAVNILEVPLIVVCGHSGCGAVNTAFENPNNLSPYLQAIVDKIKPAVVGSNNANEAAQKNVEMMVETIKNDTTIIHENNNVEVLGAYYDVLTGDVNWY